MEISETTRKRLWEASFITIRVTFSDDRHGIDPFALVPIDDQLRQRSIPCPRRPMKKNKTHNLLPKRRSWTHWGNRNDGERRVDKVIGLGFGLFAFLVRERKEKPANFCRQEKLTETAPLRRRLKRKRALASLAWAALYFMVISVICSVRLRPGVAARIRNRTLIPCDVREPYYGQKSSCCSLLIRWLISSIWTLFCGQWS